MFGLPIPDDKDGRVLKEIFEEGSDLARGDIRHEGTEGEDGKEQIKARVKELKAFGNT